MRRIYTVPPFDLRVVFLDTRRDFFVVHKGEHRAAVGEGTRGICVPGDNVDFIIGVFNRKLPTLVHECSHCAVFILQLCGIDPMSNNDEPQAFLTEHLFEVGRKRLNLR